ncbi:MAG: tetratricopeptide repeat protein [Actinobacteria bacterium]|nr:tetratricopeptide repeat protein [Actinomycetota bacterium]
MDQARFSEAKAAYDSGDFRTAAKSFLAAAGRGTDGNGAAYHMAGNSLMRLRRHADAVTVYGHALRDELYEKRGAIQANMAAAQVALGEYAEAVEGYRAASEESDYPTPHKALQGMAGALVEMGRYEEAAGAYRQAALDSDNPDPGKSLNNLGLCFMAIGRPGDAVEAYKAALGFDTYAGRGKALANLGIAFAAMGEHKEAVKAFEKATQLHGHPLSQPAIDTFESSRAALTSPQREVVDGWQTGEIPPVISPVTSVMDDDEPTLSYVPPSGDPASTGELFGDTEESAFFTATEDELKEQDRAQRREQRDARREQRNPWQLPLTIVVAVLVLLSFLAALYFAGYGFPTQKMTAEGMLTSRAEGQPVDGYWVAVPKGDVEKEMSKVPAMIKDFQVGPIDRSARTSKVDITVTPQNGAPLRYTVTVTREGVGWKVSGIENDWGTSGKSE